MEETKLLENMAKYKEYIKDVPYRIFSGIC
jgi:protein-S-isoprenylcysteine O-methyltransferase Ste14